MKHLQVTQLIVNDLMLHLLYQPPSAPADSIRNVRYDKVQNITFYVSWEVYQPLHCLILHCFTELLCLASCLSQSIPIMILFLLAPFTSWGE